MSSALHEAAEAAHRAYFDDEGPTPVELACMERAFRKGVEALARELPEEAVEAAFRAVYPTAEGKSDHVAKGRIREFVTGFLRALLVSEGGG